MSVLEASRSVRRDGCVGHSGTRAPLASSRLLDAAAAFWSRGLDLKAALSRAGYREQQTAALHVHGEASLLPAVLREKLCTPLTQAVYADLGSSRSGEDVWILLAAPFLPPAPENAGKVANDVLARLNRARAQPRHCGSRVFAPVPPLQASELLQHAAEAHARDMVVNGYFSHAGLDGSTPAQRVAATGYRYRVVGENIASGPQTAAKAADGWLASPEHCENIMDPRFSESGVAFAATRSGPPHIYWVQEFAQPR